MLIGSGAALLPPARHHAQHTHDNAGGKGAEHDQNLRCAPLRAKEKMDRGVLLVVQREGKQGKKYGGFQSPLQQPQELVH